MKILYGIQGTGNGHISRARLMARHFAEKPVEVTYLVSGRSPDKLFDMEIFSDITHRRGLTFTIVNGRINYFRTVLNNNVFQFIRDVFTLDIHGYDLIISDFEPITAWAGKLRRVPVIALGHQYAFDQSVPTEGGNVVSRLIMKFFAPASTRIGLHWDRFKNDILPPIINPQLKSEIADCSYTLVYMPFEDQERLTKLLNQFHDHQFIQYSPDIDDGEKGNVLLRKTCLNGFKCDLIHSDGVICNSGFELISECLYLGKPVLAKPLHRQVEQLSNARALDELGYAATIHTLDTITLERWLVCRKRLAPMAFPDVAKELVEWIIGGRQEALSSMVDRLWLPVTNSGD